MSSADDGATSTPPKTSSYRPSLDGLRAVAILMVVAYHDHVLAGGFLGVDVFFVLSGFLITTILLREHRSSGTIHLGRFYARRFLRLAPALAVFVLVTFVVTHWVAPGLSSWLTPRWALAALGYVTNLLTAFHREYPLGVVSICWSLAQEEQFYLLWPLSLLALLRRGLSRGTLALILGMLIAGSLGLRLFLLARHGADPDLWLRVYFGPDTRAEALLWGCLLALFLPGVPTGRMAARFSGLGGVVGIGTLAYLASTREIEPFVRSPLLFTVSAVASLLVVAAAQGPGVLRRTLEWPVLVWIGQLSYSLYLWHAVSGDFLAHEGPIRKHVLMLSLAVASHYLVERPLLGFNRRFGAVPRPHPRLFPRLGDKEWAGIGGSHLATGFLGVATALTLACVRLTGAELPFLALDPAVRVRERTDDAQRQAALGRALARAKRPAEAQDAFLKALALDTNQADAHLGLGGLALDRMDFGKAIDELSRAAALRPADAAMRNELGVACALAGRLDEAVLHFRASLRLRSDPKVADNLRKAEADRAARAAHP